MTQGVKPRGFAPSRAVALTAAFLVAVVFVAANAHLVLVSVRSQPECALQPLQEGAASYRAAKPSC
ncbi:hypothetical protein JHW45_07105 [Paracoccus stylophorae]|uniref:Uncharacterized protein n=1 Tax=Paracoccus stylophorae TaxID=659350 RepID=A0ABY7SZ62_9RHOB|nr:hypothetical protein [Paracoccus stylophorae]WCR12100.1 hypothetical protein JHW45_07105 [Paracoccus stylophorae]